MFATCSAVSCYVIMAFHHFLSLHPLDCASFTPSSIYTFTELSQFLREFHLHWEVTAVTEPVEYNLEKKLWKITNIFSFRSEPFQCNFKLLFVLFFVCFSPATANYPHVCVHTTLNKPIEIYFTGKFRKIKNEC